MICGFVKYLDNFKTIPKACPSGLGIVLLGGAFYG